MCVSWKNKANIVTQGDLLSIFYSCRFYFYITSKSHINLKEYKNVIIVGTTGALVLVVTL